MFYDVDIEASAYIHCSHCAMPCHAAYAGYTKRVSALTLLVGHSASK